MSPQSSQKMLLKTKKFNLLVTLGENSGDRLRTIIVWTKFHGNLSSETEKQAPAMCIRNLSRNVGMF